MIYDMSWPENYAGGENTATVTLNVYQSDGTTIVTSGLVSAFSGTDPNELNLAFGNGVGFTDDLEEGAARWCTLQIGMGASATVHFKYKNDSGEVFNLTYLDNSTPTSEKTLTANEIWGGYGEAIGMEEPIIFTIVPNTTVPTLSWPENYAGGENTATVTLNVYQSDGTTIVTSGLVSAFSGTDPNELNLAFGNGVGFTDDLEEGAARWCTLQIGMGASATVHFKYKNDSGEVFNLTYLDNSTQTSEKTLTANEIWGGYGEAIGMEEPIIFTIVPNTGGGGGGGDTEKPVITSLTTGINLVENSGAGQTVYTIVATDNVGVTSYSIGGTDASLLTVNSSTGVVTLNANPDYETKSSYSFTAIATDAAGNNSDPKTVTFSISNVNEPTTGKPGITSNGNVSSPLVGNVLTATAGNIADPDGLGAFSYQWKRAGANISSATSSTYTIVRPDIGSTITVSVSFTDGGGFAAGPVTSDPTGTVAPTNIQCLSQDSPNSVQMINPYTFNNIAHNANGVIGVNDGTYVLTGVTNSHPIGFVINDTTKFEVTGGTSSGSSTVEGINVAFYTGDVTFVVKGNFGIISYYCQVHGYMGGEKRLMYSTTCPVYEAPPNNPATGVPTIAGTPALGQTLTANTNNIQDADGIKSTAYQWKRNGANISGATNSTYTVVGDDIGTTITVTVTITDNNDNVEQPRTSAGVAISALDDKIYFWTQYNDASNNTAIYYGIYNTSKISGVQLNYDLSLNATTGHTTTVADVSYNEQDQIDNDTMIYKKEWPISVINNRTDTSETNDTGVANKQMLFAGSMTQSINGMNTGVFAVVRGNIILTSIAAMVDHNSNFLTPDKYAIGEPANPPEITEPGGRPLGDINYDGSFNDLDIDIMTAYLLNDTDTVFDVYGGDNVTTLHTNKTAIDIIGTIDTNGKIVTQGLMSEFDILTYIDVNNNNILDVGDLVRMLSKRANPNFSITNGV